MWPCFRGRRQKPEAGDVEANDRMAEHRSIWDGGLGSEKPLPSALSLRPWADDPVEDPVSGWNSSSHQGARGFVTVVSETCGAAGWDGDTGLASSAERREDIPLGPQVLLTLPHSQGPDPWGGPS